jgi:hypothetical protein
MISHVGRKSAPFSMRLPEETDVFVTEEAQRTRRPKGAVVASLAEEALKARLFPGIAFRGRDWDRRAWVMGTAYDVWEVVRAVEDLGSPQRAVEETDLTDRQIRLAMAYRDRFPDEIDEAIRLSRRTVDELRREYPTFDVIRVPD